MRARRPVIGAYFVVAALAVPSLVAAQAPSGDPASPGTVTQADPASGADAAQPNSRVSSSAASTSPATTPTYGSKHAKSTAGISTSSSVKIINFKFSPKKTSVGVGDTVTWTNNDDVTHNATGDGIKTGDLKQGQSGSHTFSKAGTYSYICTIHPSMKASVVVGGGGGGGGGGGSGGAGGTSASPSSSTGSTSTGLSESAAGTSSGAAGSSSSLPMTGEDLGGLVVAGALLLTAGAVVRRLRPRSR